MTTAQLIFSVALGVITLIIVLFSTYVLASTTWAGKWVRAPRPQGKDSGHE